MDGSRHLNKLEHDTEFTWSVGTRRALRLEDVEQIKTLIVTLAWEVGRSNGNQWSFVEKAG